MTLRILIVDDEPTIHKVMNSYLRKFLDDYELITATTGSEAVKKAGACIEQGHPPDFVLMDLKMPEMNGLECTRALTEMGVKNIHLLTAYFDTESLKDAVEVGRIFGVNQGADGFFLEEHPKLAPLNTATDGVFLAGTCQGPKDITDTVAQASGAAAKALSLATLGKVEVSPTIAWIDPDICAGCQTCIELCAYSAIEFDERRGVSVINEAVCKGCGSCSGFCPSGAAQVKHFTKKQMLAEFDGLMDSLHAVGM